MHTRPSLPVRYATHTHSGCSLQVTVNCVCKSSARPACLPKASFSSFLAVSAGCCHRLRGIVTWHHHARVNALRTRKPQHPPVEIRNQRVREFCVGLAAGWCMCNRV
jgi:hypothetical protein